MTSGRKLINAAIDRLASCFEFGHLQACTDPAAFLDEVRGELESLRAQVATLTEKKASTDAAVNDHLAHLARVTEERDLFRGMHETAFKQAADVVEEYAQYRINVTSDWQGVAAARDSARAEVSRLRAALERAIVMLEKP